MIYYVWAGWCNSVAATHIRTGLYVDDARACSSATSTRNPHVKYPVTHVRFCKMAVEEEEARFLVLVRVCVCVSLVYGSFRLVVSSCTATLFINFNCIQRDMCFVDTSYLILDFYCSGSRAHQKRSKLADFPTVFTSQD